MQDTIKLIDQIDGELKLKRHELWREYMRSRYVWNKQQNIIRYWPTIKEAEEDLKMYNKIFGIRE